MDRRNDIKLRREGAEVTIAAMDEDARACIGQQTYYFVKRMLRDPELRKLHAQKKVELQAAGYFNSLPVAEAVQ